MAVYSFPPSVGTIGPAGYSGPASGFNAYKAAQVGLGVFNTGSGALPATPAADTPLLQSITSDIGSLTAQAAQNQAASEAAATQAEGYGKEVDAYNTVGAIAAENATIEGVSGNIRQLAANRRVNATIGSQRAAVASAGFASSGSSLDIMKSSIQQGYLDDQIIRTQTALTQGGYLEQGAAAQAEAAGGKLASDAALSLSKAQAAAGQLATANATSETAALKAYIASTGGINSADRALVTSTLDPTKPTTFTPPAAAASGTGAVPGFGGYGATASYTGFNRA